MNDIKQALHDLKCRLHDYEKYQNYYSGNHPFNFASEKFKQTFGRTFQRLKDNLCPVVVDTLVDRLEVVNFSSDEYESDVYTQAWQIWSRNLMPLRAQDVHREALVTGDAYVLLWQTEDGRAILYPQRASNCTVCYDEETREVKHGAKFWCEGKHVRLNLYYADRIEKYITEQPTSTLPDKPEAFIPYEEEPLVEHDYGFVPLFHLSWNSGMRNFGTSALAQLPPLQDALNKALCDMFVNMEYTAFPQRYAVGLALERDEQGNPKQPFQAGVDRLWVSEGIEGRFGQFEPSDNTQFLAIQDSLRTEIARISGVPFHYLMFGQGGFPSGEAMKTAEARLLAKVKLAQIAFGAKWAEVMRAALMIEGNYVESPVTVSWADPAPRSEREMLESLLVKQQLGASSDTLLIESGYSEEDLARMKVEKESARDGQELTFNAM
ncbi:MAG TPA: phage portal protein [Pyrinomonadaceae bacterium]|jgi:hypothetical protein|nr:phage portal protein [Pyrinomonadaceae bacterium]